MLAAVPQALKPLQWLQESKYLLGISHRPQPNSFFGRHLCALSSMVTNSEGLHTIEKMILSTTQIFTPAQFITNSTHALISIHNFFKSVNVVSDVNRWIKGCPACYRSYLSMTASALFTVSDAACTINFTNSIGLINSGKAAANLGAISLFGLKPLLVLTNVTLVGFIAATELGGFAITTYQVTSTLKKGKITNEQWASLISKAAEITIRILILGASAFVSTITGVASVGFLGLVAAGGIGYNIYNKNLATCSVTNR